MFTSEEISGGNHAGSSLTVMVDFLCSSSKVNSPQNDSAGLTLDEGRDNPMWRSTPWPWSLCKFILFIIDFQTNIFTFVFLLLKRTFSFSTHSHYIKTEVMLCLMNEYLKWNVLLYI